MSEDVNGQWYVIHTLSGQENKIKDSIERIIKSEGEESGVLEVFLATEKVSEVRQGKKYTTTRKLFPGYMNVRLDLYDEDGKIKENVWHSIQNVQGVIGFVGEKKHPIPLSEEEVEDMIYSFNQEAEETAKPKVVYQPGDVVRVKEGPFANFEAKIDEIDYERGRLKLMVSIFGRSTPLELEFWQVEREV